MSEFYSMDDYRTALPYGRVIEDGTVFRIETDGHGHLRPPIAEQTDGKCYGVPREVLYAKVQRRGTSQDHTKRVERKRQRVRAVFVWLKANPGATKDDVADVMGISHAVAYHDLAELRIRGLVEMEPVARRGQNGSARWFARSRREG